MGDVIQKEGAFAIHHRISKAPNNIELNAQSQDDINILKEACQSMVPLASLDRVGVKFSSDIIFIFKCEQCGASWDHSEIRDGDLKQDYWKCPNKCNIDKGQRQTTAH